MKRREFLKTLLLTALVISSVVLASKIWFSKELWSDDYNSFNYNNGFFSKITALFGKKTKAASLDYNQIFFPKQFLVSQSGKTVLIRPTDQQYELLSEDVKTVLADMFSSFSVSQTDETEFRRACRAPSVFADFYNITSLSMLGDYFGVADEGELSGINGVKHLLISADSPTVYVKNETDGMFYRISFNGDISKINERLGSLVSSASDSQKLYSYAFENSFDVLPADENAPKRLLLDPYIIINIQSETAPAIKKAEPEKNDQRNYGGLLSLFGMNINTSRRFSENDGTVNLVENFAAVRIRNGGFLEYDCISPSEGIPLKDVSSDYDIIRSVGEFIEKVSAFYPLREGNDYVFCRFIGADGKYTVYFDITYNGIPVFLADEKSQKSAVHCIAVTVDNARIVNYKHFLSSFEGIGTDISVKNMINALDEFYGAYDTQSNPGAIINDMYNTYYLNGAGAASVNWVISLSNNDSVVIEGGM